MPVESKGFVSNNHSPMKTQLQIMKLQRELKNEDSTQVYNSNKEGQNMENHFKDEDGELDQMYVPFLV